MDTQAKLLAELKEIASQINLIEAKRKVLGSGGKAEYHSPLEVITLRRKFADVQKKHKRLWIKNFNKKHDNTI
jgi:hypothetical protein